MGALTTVVGFIGFMLVLGSAGALEMNNITMLQCLWQSLIGLLLMSVSIFFSLGMKTEEVNK